MKFIGLILLILFTSCQTIHAESYKISNPSELITLKNLNPGDEVIISSGVYNSKKMHLNATGTESKPILLKAERAGTVIFTGESTLLLSGSYIVVSDLHFKDPKPIGSKSPIEMRTNDSKLQNCVISGVNTKEDDSTDNKWVSIYGQRNTIEHCSFIDKKNIGCLLVVWMESGIIPRHKILNNYFSRPTTLLESDGSKKNGQECIRIGTSDYSLNRAECLVANNTFYRCDAEIEAISNKSCFNKFSNNLFLESQGALTLRHGNNSLVEGNFFIGNNREGTAGIRVIGDHQILKNNYFENIRGSNYQAAICLIQGVVNSPLNRYFQVKDCRVEGNIIKNCYNGIVISYGSSEDQSLPVISTEIVQNTIYNDNQSNYSIVWIDTPQTPDVAFINNTIYGGKTKNFDSKLSPQTTIRPSISDVSNIWLAIKSNSGAEWFK
jgi:poly(beta-D-mannuronate) lyase